MEIQAGDSGVSVSQNLVDYGDKDIEIILNNGREWSFITCILGRLVSLKMKIDKQQNAFREEITYLNAERMESRIYYTDSGDDWILNNGGNSACLIDRADLENTKIHPLLTFDGHVSEFSIHVDE